MGPSMNDSIVERLRGERLDYFWPTITRELDRIAFLWKPWWTLESIRERIDNEQVQCWAAGDAQTIRLVAFTQLVAYPQQCVAQAFLLFGTELDKHLPELLVVFERFGIANGCQSLEVVGRDGWQRRLKAAGFEKAQVVLQKNIANVRMQ